MDLYNNIKTTDIPELFYSDLGKKPFKYCIYCEKELLVSQELYLIEKALRFNPDLDIKNTIFEYAICMECAFKLRQQMSLKSRERIERFMMHESNIIENSNKLNQEKDYALSSWIGQCAVSGKSMNETKEFQIFGQCAGDKMLYANMPYMVSGEVIEQMTELLSDETRGEMEGFMDNFFGIPPEYEEYFTGKKILII